MKYKLLIWIFVFVFLSSFVSAFFLEDTFEGVDFGDNWLTADGGGAVTFEAPGMLKIVSSATTYACYNISLQTGTLSGMFNISYDLKSSQTNQRMQLGGWFSGDGSDSTSRNSILFIRDNGQFQLPYGTSLVAYTANVWDNVTHEVNETAQTYRIWVNGVLETGWVAFSNAKITKWFCLFGWTSGTHYLDNLTIYNESRAPPVADTTPPVNSSWNITSDNIYGTQNSTVWITGGLSNITSNLLSLTVTTNESSNGSCAIGLNYNHTTLIATNANYKMSTTDTTSHSYTVYDNLTIGNQCLYCSFKDSLQNEFANSSSGCLEIYYNYTNLTVTLVGPPNLSSVLWYNYKHSGHIFNYTVATGTSKNFTNCSLWTNSTGDLVYNQTNSSAIKNETDGNNSFAAINISRKCISWNVQCYDNYSGPEGPQFDWADNNFTFCINNSVPTMTNANGSQNESISIYTPINLTAFSDDLDNDTINYSVVYENASGLDCTITNDSLSFIQGPLYPTGNFSCMIEFNDSFDLINYSIGIEIVAFNISFDLSSGISDWDLIPDNDTHSGVEPVDQTSTLGVFNITNNEAFNLTIQFFTFIYQYGIRERLVEDFNNLLHWKIFDIESTNSTWNWSVACMAFQPTPLNQTQGRYSGRIKYSFDNAQVREYYNGSIWNRTNMTFDCATTNFVYWNFTRNFTGYNETYNTNWTGFDTFNFSFLGDNSSNLISVNLTNSTGTVFNSSVYSLKNDSAWRTASIDISKLVNISQIIIQVTFNASVNSSFKNETGLFYLDNLLIYNSTSDSGITLKVLDYYNYTNSTVLNTSYQNITQDLENKSDQLYWLFANYSRIITPLYYDFYARGIING